MRHHEAMGRNVEIGYVASLEKRAPRESVDLAVHAEKHGFVGTLATDHFQPWLPHHGDAPFVWSVLASLGERTTSHFGPGMAVPGYRYHPATLAQAAATTAAMFPGRHWLGIGAGEALNEHVTANYWPEAPERISRMFEAIELIKKLFAASQAGRDTRFTGTYHQMESTRLWTMPAESPPILVATVGPMTARRAGKVADGIVTVGTSYDRAATVLEQFDRGCAEAGRDPVDTLKVLHLHLSWAETDELARATALDRWPIGAMDFPKGDIRNPRVFAQIARQVGLEGFAGRLVMSADPDVHRAHIQRFADLGFDRIYLNNVADNHPAWVEEFGREVLPRI